MNNRKEKTWQCEVSGGIDGNTTLFGVNIFNYKWENTGKRVTVYSPNGRESFDFYVYAVTINGQRHEFAAGEFRACIWGFYLEKY